MTARRHLRASDLRGLARLATQATENVTLLVEGVHQSVWDTLGVRGGATPGRTGGFTGLVYDSVRGTARILGEGAEAVLSTLERRAIAAADSDDSTAARADVMAMLNGVLGDHLVTTRNPLATGMTLRYRGEVLGDRATAHMPEPTGKVLLLVHGLCLNEGHWQSQHEGQVVDHGAALAASLDYTPVHLRYNTGLHTSQNGNDLSGLLEQLVRQWPVPVEELTVLAHSMGGLVARSACLHAERQELSWRGLLKHIVFLGTPHHGAPLERAGNWVDQVLGGMRYTAPFAMLGKLRSAGITDLRHGHVVEQDWQGHDRFESKVDRRQVVPLPAGVACHAVAASVAPKRSPAVDRVIGDGLVPIHSALGEHEDARRTLGFAPASQWIAYRTNHMQLLGSPEVTRRIEQWLSLPGA